MSLRKVLRVIPIGNQYHQLKILPLSAKLPFSLQKSQRSSISTHYSCRTEPLISSSPFNQLIFENNVPSKFKNVFPPHVKHFSNEVLEEPEPPKEEESFEKKLKNIENILQTELKLIFDARHEYRIYTPDILFYNHWDPQKTITTKGLTRYILQILKFRWYFHFRYPKLKVTLEKSFIDAANGVVTFDWSLAALNTSALFKIREVSPQKMQQQANQHASIFQGSSSFHVNSKGFIHKHHLSRGHQLAVNEA